MYDFVTSLLTVVTSAIICVDIYLHFESILTTQWRNSSLENILIFPKPLKSYSSCKQVALDAKPDEEQE